VGRVHFTVEHRFYPAEEMVALYHEDRITEEEVKEAIKIYPLESGNERIIITEKNRFFF
jgi:hypothetical protein